MCIYIYPLNNGFYHGINVVASSPKDTTSNMQVLALGWANTSLQ